MRLRPDRLQTAITDLNGMMESAGHMQSVQGKWPLTDLEEVLFEVTAWKEDEWCEVPTLVLAIETRCGDVVSVRTSTEGVDDMLFFLSSLVLTDDCFERVNCWYLDVVYISGEGAPSTDDDSEPIGPGAAIFGEDY
jgi:hypothetical protein